MKRFFLRWLLPSSLLFVIALTLGGIDVLAQNTYDITLKADVKMAFYMKEWQGKLERIRRYRPHILGEGEERLMALAGPALAQPVKHVSGNRGQFDIGCAVAGWRSHLSLRRHDPDQVLWVGLRLSARPFQARHPMRLQKIRSLTVPSVQGRPLTMNPNADRRFPRADRRTGLRQPGNVSIPLPLLSGT